MTALYLKHRTNLYHARLSLLDLAPHPSLLRIFSALDNIDYVSADLMSPLAMVKMDICKMPFSPGSFDAVMCMHVLEHVPDDRQGMAELFRAMRPGAWAIVQVPIDYHRANTFEDSSVTQPEDRERLFNQEDHVRIYGRDYKDRLIATGFEVDIVPYPEELGPELIAKYGLKANADRYVWVCKKPAWNICTDPQVRVVTPSFE
jgi:SAM-dependent methyltransferase